MRRDAPRASADGEPITFRYRGDDGEVHAGRVLNVAPGGLKVTLYTPPADKQDIDFELTLDGTKTIKGTGRIAWSREGGGPAGLAFVNLADREKGLLDLWMAQRQLRRGS